MANELFHLIKQISADRGLDPETLYLAIESAVLAAARKNMPTAKELRVEIDRKTGEPHLFTQKTIVHVVTDEVNEIDRKAARKLYGPEIQYDMVIEAEIPAQDLGRIAAQTVKQIILQKIRDAQRERIYDNYKSRVNQIVSGVVQRFEHDGIVVDTEHTEALIPYSEVPKNHGLRQGERVRALCIEVKTQAKGPQVILSRNNPDLVRRLFEQEVPEIEDGVVTIESVSRVPGDRAKIAVSCKDKNVDPVGACVGMKGSRVQVVVRELKGEKVDIVPWSDDPIQYIANALNPAKILQVRIDPANHSAIVYVEENQLSLAIGKLGQNAKLAAKLTSWRMDIQTLTPSPDTTEENNPTEPIESDQVPQDQATLVTEPTEPEIQEEKE